MKGDFSRRIFDAHKHYAGVLHQQGRVWLDSDWNEEVFESLNLLQQETSDIVGLCGVPEPGTAFRISPNPNVSPITPGDFLISGGPGGQGRAYVDGIMCQLDTPTTYLTQPDLPDAPVIAMPTDGSDLTALVYLEVWRRFISYLEDPSIRETALGGPDTTGRIKTIAQVKAVVIPNTVTNPTCLNSTLPVSGSGTLSTLTAPPPLPTDLCRLPDPGTFTGRENRLYRVEIHDPGNVGGTAPARFKWSRNNASFAVSVVDISKDRLTLTVSSLGRDQATALREGDVVEVCDDTSELGPARGFLTNLTSDPDPDRLTVTLASPLPFTFRLPGAITSPPSSPPTSPPLTTSDRHLILRRWDGTGNANAVFDTVQTPDMDLGEGVHIQFGGSDLRSGDYWQFTARTDGTVEALTDEPPRGILRHRCPLAIVRWSSQTSSPPSSPPGSPPSPGPYRMTVLHDCRVVFPSLAQRGLHIDAVFSVTGGLASPLQNDVQIPAQNLSGGFLVLCDAAVAPSAIGRAVCFVTAHVPVQLPRPISPVNQNPDTVYIPAVLQGDVAVNGNSIVWRPRDPNIFQQLPFNLMPAADPGILATLTIKGNFVWGAGNPSIFLDGDVFGFRQAGATSTSIRLPSGDGRRGGVFETWFWLTAAPPTRPLSFALNKVASPDLRSEGLTELAADLILTATGGLPTAAGAPVPTFDIQVSLNTNITSAPVAPGVDVVLRIDEPNTLNVTGFGSLPPPPMIGVGGAGVDYANGVVPNVFQGQLVSASSVLFAGIPVDAPGTGQRTLRIMNLRANASGAGGGLGPGSVSAVVTIPSAGFSQSVIVGSRQSCIAIFDVLNASGGVPTPPPLVIPIAQLNQSPNGSRLNAQVHFREAVAGFFRSANGERGDFRSITPPLPGIGAASQGTRFEVTFTGFPANLLQIFVTMVEATGGMRAKLVAVDSSGTLPTPAGTTSTGVPVAALTASLTAPSATGIWEWIAPVASAVPQDVSFGIVLVGSSAATPVASVQVKGSLFPISTVATSTAGAPVPRFVDDSVTLNPGFRTAGN
jgi:hypothetical protein